MEEIWVRKCSSWEEEAEADREFWAGMSAEERVEAVETIRREAIAKTNDLEGRIQKVVRVIRRQRS